METTQQIVDEDEEFECRPTKLVKVIGGQDIPREIVVTAEVSIGRTASAAIPDKRVSGTHCCVAPVEGGLFVTDLSSNGTYVNGTKLDKGKRAKLKHGDTIGLVKSVIEFIVVVEPSSHSAAPTGDQPNEVGSGEKRAAEELAPGEESAAKVPKTSSTDTMEEHLICVICQELLHQPVCAVPCLHNFCGGCLTPWISKGKHTCPECRVEVSTIQSSHKIQSLVQAYLEAHPDKRRSPDDLKDLEDKNQIKPGVTVKVSEIAPDHGPSWPAGAMVGFPHGGLVHDSPDSDEEDSGEFESDSEEEEDEDSEEDELHTLWEFAVQHGKWDCVKVQMSTGTTFGLRENQKAELRRWLAGQWDRQWLRTSTSMAGYHSLDDTGPNGVPSHFIGRDSSMHKLLLDVDGVGYEEIYEGSPAEEVSWEPATEGLERCAHGGTCSLDPAADLLHFLHHSHPIELWKTVWRQAIEQDQWAHVKA